jgi:hypothetical protein
VIGVGKGHACYRCLIKECIDLEVIRERFGGILSLLRRCCPEGLPRPLPAIRLERYDFERSLEAIKRGLLAIVVAVVPFGIEPNRLRPKVHPGDQERFGGRGRDHGNDSLYFKRLTHQSSQDSP